MGIRSSMFVSTILVILATIQSLESKKISTNLNFNSEQRSSRSVECLRGADGLCQPVVEEAEEVAKRQSNCDPQAHLNCRLTIGRKRSLGPKPVFAKGNLDCYSPAKRTSILCKLTVLRQHSTTSCISEDCVKRDGKDKEKDKLPCDPRSPLCYSTFPGKRLGHQDEVPPRMTEKRQAANDLKASILRDDDKQERDCNPKRNYYCRYRIPGKRDKIIESTIKKTINQK